MHDFDSVRLPVYPSLMYWYKVPDICKIGKTSTILKYYILYVLLAVPAVASSPCHAASIAAFVKIYSSLYTQKFERKTVWISFKHLLYIYLVFSI